MHQQRAGPDVAELPDQPGARRHAGGAGDVGQGRRGACRRAEPPSHQGRRAERHRGLHDGHEAQQGGKLRVVRAGLGREGERRGAEYGQGEEQTPEGPGGGKRYWALEVGHAVIERFWSAACNRCKQCRSLDFCEGEGGRSHRSERSALARRWKKPRTCFW